MSGTIFRPICMLMVIIDRKRNHVLEDVFRRHNLTYTLSCMGEGTANHEILDYLGLDITKKQVVMTPIPLEESDEIVESISRDMELEKPGNGIAFILPISGIAGSMAMDILTK